MTAQEAIVQMDVHIMAHVVVTITQMATVHIVMILTQDVCGMVTVQKSLNALVTLMTVLKHVHIVHMMRVVKDLYVVKT